MADGVPSFLKEPLQIVVAVERHKFAPHQQDEVKRLAAEAALKAVTEYMEEHGID